MLRRRHTSTVAPPHIPATSEPTTKVATCNRRALCTGPLVSMVGGHTLLREHVIGGKGPDAHLDWRIRAVFWLLDYFARAHDSDAAPPPNAATSPKRNKHNPRHHGEDACSVPG